MTDTDSQTVVLGKIAGFYGLKGWLKVLSWCQPREQIFNYRPWRLKTATGFRVFDSFTGKPHGKGLIVQFPGMDDRNAATELLHAEILIDRQHLPELNDGSYYWHDLQGLQVVTDQGVKLGTVKQVFATGANDVLVVNGERERLIPFVQGSCIQKVDLDRQIITVDWDPEF